MEMFERVRNLPRRFIPWDVLQVSEQIDTSYRVYKNSIHWKFWRRYKGLVGWNPFDYKNLGVFYGERSQRKIFIDTFIRATKECGIGNNTIEFYDFDEEEFSLYADLDDKYSFFRYHPMSESNLKEFLDALQKHKNLIREKSAGVRVLEPGNKRLQIFVLNLTKQHIIELHSDANLTMQLVDLLNDYTVDRCFLFLLCESAVELPREIFEVLDMAAFIGDENKKIAEDDLYSHMSKGYHAVTQKKIGVLFDKEKSYLVIIHPRKYELSKYGKNFYARQKAQKNLYREWLDSLPDENIDAQLLSSEEVAKLQSGDITLDDLLEDNLSH